MPEHAARAAGNGARCYVASAAKFTSGIGKAHARCAEIARHHSMTVLMSNGVGATDGQACAGGSAVWNDDGLLIGQLNDRDEGLIVYDTETRTAVGRYR